MNSPRLPAPTPHSAWQNITLIAGREITTRARQRSFLITTGLLMLVIVIAIVVGAWFSGKSSTEKVGLVNATPGLSSTLTATGDALDTPLSITSVDTADAARAQVRDGDLDAAVIVGRDSSYVLLSKSSMDASLDSALRSGIAQFQLGSALSERGVELTDLPAARISAVQTSVSSSDAGERVSIALIGSMLLMAAIMTGGLWVAVGVVEEKTSRIVELLLSAVRPLHLLWGKIIGIGAVVVTQVLLLGITALAAGIATGLLTIAGTAVTMLAVVLAWFVLGFLFFATLYAAAGAMVSRQEELNASSAPLTVLAMAVLYSGLFGAQSLDSPLISTLSWIPPFSAVLMPIRIATGNTDAVQVVGTFALMILACLLAVWGASRIYQRSVLRTGTRMKWGEVARMLRRQQA